MIYIAPDLKRIYGSTRSWDGKPGEAYWQNSAAYNRRHEDMNNSIEITSMKINGIMFNWEENSRGIGTIMYIDSLPQALLPGTELVLEISWNYQLNEKFLIRCLGKIKVLDSGFQ